MENSFFEYRDKTGVNSGSDSEIIDDSYVETVTYSCKKKNHTVVPESDESTSNDESMKEELPKPKYQIRRSVAGGHVICSSEDDDSRRGSIRRPSQSDNNMVLTSSEEEELSPELLPKRRPPRQSTDSHDSLILRRTKKRMLFIESDTDNSLIIEQNKNRKQPCLKQTPLKIVTDNSNGNESIHFGDVSSDADKSDVDKSDHHDSDGHEMDHHDSDGHESDNYENEGHESDEEDKHEKDTEIRRKCKKLVINSDVSTDEIVNTSKENKQNDTSGNDYCGKNDDDHTGDQITEDDCSDLLITDDDDGPDEDMMVMSRATRMSIMGVIPKDDDSDDSDFIRSGSSSRNSKNSIAGSLEDLPEITINRTPQKSAESDDDLPEVSIHKTPEKVESDDDLPEVTLHSTPDKTLELDDSKLSCSPFSNSIHDISNTIHNSPKMNSSKIFTKSKALTTNPKVTDYMDLTLNIPNKQRDLSNVGVIDLSNIDSNAPSNKELDKSVSVLTKKQAAFEDDDVTIIDTRPEIIALSSDDEDEVKTSKKSPRSKSPKNKSGVRDHDYNKENIGDVDSSYGNEKTGRGNTIEQYLVPPSYPSHVKFVKKHVRDNELDKLRRLQEDLASVRHLLQEMDMDHLPDGGSRLLQRLSSLEEEVRRQGDKVANMVEEPDDPSAVDIARDGFNKGLSWDDIQKASNEVQPRMFGKQAMATHVAERGLILSRLRDLHASLASRPAESTAAAAPRLLRTALMPHQLHALAWLQWRETQKPCAGILADDMGLGKTITMISLIANDKQNNIDRDDDEDESTVRGKLVRGGTLVVCPASLIQQWAGEVSKHCTSHALSVCLHHGAARATQPQRLATYDMVATTYNIMQRDNEKNGVLMRIQWRRIILDEAHIVRNHKASTSVAVSNLKGKRRWCLTGTPVQNKDLDLFALLKFMRCTPFDDIQMWKKWINNKSQGGEERLSTIMRCILLRRTKVQLQQKGQLACLPTKTPHMTEVTLNKEEMNVYQKVLVLSKTLFAQFLHQRAEKNADYTSFRSRGKDSEYDKMHKKMVALQGVTPVKSHEILVLLLRLRQVCCHCGLIAAMLDHDTAAAPHDPASSDLLRELDKLSLEDNDRRKSVNPGEEDGNAESATADEAIRAVLSPNNPVFQLKRPSSKISEVMKCLNERVFANKGDKAVVVSQWTSVLRLVEHELNMQKIRSVTLSGNVPVPARPQLINAVNDPNSDVKVMLLSLCAGGVGINLCGANHLLLLDPHWNPQLEEQAQDRIYRVGQKKDVHIYRFMCVGTVEQTIRKLQEAKLQLAENVLTGARNNGASTLSIEDLKMLFNMGSD